MRTVRCSSRLLRGCLPGGCLSRGGVSAWVGCLPGGVPIVNRILDTRLWKHYLSATSFAGGNYIERICKRYEKLTLTGRVNET